MCITELFMSYIFQIVFLIFTFTLLVEIYWYIAHPHPDVYHWTSTDPPQWYRCYIEQYITLTCRSVSLGTYWPPSPIRCWITGCLPCLISIHISSATSSGLQTHCHKDIHIHINAVCFNGTSYLPIYSLT